MKIFAKILLIFLSVVLTSILGFYLVFVIITSGINLDENKLVNLDYGVIFYDKDGKVMSKESNGISTTPLNELKDYTVNAFISIEDKRFYNHKGVDYKGLIRASVNNVKSFSFKEGASTISQQLIKNTHLSSEKTLKRKLCEVKLSKQLEKKYTKKDILEKYLNTIYFGENCYGITNASKIYFNKTPSELSVNESAVLAGIIKAPSKYSPFVNMEKCVERRNVVLKKMYEQGYLNATDYEKSINDEIELEEKDYDSYFGYNYLLKKNFRELADNYAYSKNKIYVYTTFDENLQEKLLKIIDEDNTENCNKSAIILENNGNISAYYSTCGETNRNLGSTIKPILVYAPAIEENFINTCTPISDEKTDFSGYCPSNFNDKYYGYVSAKESLAKSLNTCAVKILNGFGVEKSLSYLKKTGIIVTENDKNLGIALGSTEKGATLTEIVGAYNVFVNNGEYIKPTCITKITDSKENVLYEKNESKRKVFSSETCFLINDCLQYCVTNGTAKKLSYTNIPLCAKTGTVGNEKGNTDAYSISYNKDFTLGVWFGNIENSLLDNSLSGGTVPTELSSKLWKKIYENKTPKEFNICDKVKLVKLDKISYDEENKIILSDDKSPERYIKYEYFKENNIPKLKSDRFSNPKMESPILSVNYNNISIKLCLTQYVDAIIFKEENGKKNLVYDTANKINNNVFVDYDIIPNTEYNYTVIPYFNNSGEKFLGEETVFNNVKIFSDYNISNDWWQDDFID